MSNKIAIVVDSTAGLTKEEAKKHNITIIPLFFYFGEQFYKDGDFTQDEFFELVEKYYQETKTLPQTSQPSIGTCIEVFSKLLETYDDVIYYTMSSKLSGTYQNGVLASNEFNGKVKVVDSLFTSAVLKQLAIQAAGGVDDGQDIDQIIDNSQKIIKNSSIKLIIDDLSHLQRTGRLNATQAVIGSMLKLKPILSIEDGLINPVDKVRSLNKAHKLLCDEIISYNVTGNDYLCIAHSNGLEYAQNIEKYLKSKINDINIEINDLSGVVSTHTGPRTCGIVYIKDLYI